MSMSEKSRFVIAEDLVDGNERILDHVDARDPVDALRRFCGANVLPRISDDSRVARAILFKTQLSRRTRHVLPPGQTSIILIARQQ